MQSTTPTGGTEVQRKAPTRNIAARAGSWSARHRKTAIFGWLAFVFIALALGSAAGMKKQGSETGPGESGQANAAIERSFPKEVTEQVLIQKTDTDVADRELAGATAEVVATLGQTEHVRDLRSPLDRGNAAQLAPDGRSALVTFKLSGDFETSQENVKAPLAAVAALQEKHPELRIEEAGEGSVSKALADSTAEDFHRAETLSLPITMLILVIAFGAVVAAGIPLLLALSAVAGTFGLVNLVSHITPVNPVISSVLLLVGLAVGVDYTMFYLRREREERAKGRSSREAIDIAAATSGRAVLVSGFTVMIAMAGMYLAGSETFTSFGTGTILVVAVAMIGSLTVLPALLAWLGDRVEKGRVPFLHRVRKTDGDSRIWGAVIDRVMRRPKIAAALSAGLLVALTLPVLNMHTAQPGLDSYSRDIPVMQSIDRIQAAFPGGPAPATVVVEADDVTSPEATAAITGICASRP